MRKWILYIILIAACLNDSQAQDPYFTQNLFHKLYLNPAYTGFGSKLSTTISYRNQWRNNDLPSYRTLYASADAKAFCFNNASYVAFGGYLLYDQEFGGLINNINSNLTMAASLQLSRNSDFESRMFLGISAGMYSRSYDLTNVLLFESLVTNGANFDPVAMEGMVDGSNRLVEDVGVGFGLQFTFKEKYALLLGASGSHLTSPLLYSSDRINRKFGGNMLASVSMNNGLDLKLYSDFSYQGKALRSHTGLLFGLSPDVTNNHKGDDFGIEGGVTLSLVGDDDHPVAFESVSPVLMINYLFFDFIVTKDINISTNRVSQQKGGMEFTFRFKINEHKVKSKERLPKLCSEHCPLP